MQRHTVRSVVNCARSAREYSFRSDSTICTHFGACLKLSQANFLYKRVIEKYFENSRKLKP